MNLLQLATLVVFFVNEIQIHTANVVLQYVLNLIQIQIRII